METVSVTELGKIGLVADKEPVTIPRNGWSDMQNTRCIDGSLASFAGYESLSTITELPETMLTVKTGQEAYVVYAGQSKIYSVRGGVETEIGTGFSTAGTWDSCILGGVGIFLTFPENPQYWGGAGSTVDLPYDSTGDTTCTWTDAELKAKVITSFRYHLFAMNIEDCDGYNPRKVWWSHPAEPGAVPVTWDPTKADYDAGFVELSETPGAILDALPMRDTLQIYKDDAVYAATYTGRGFANLIFNFRLVSTTHGLYARDAVCDIGGRHFFVSDGDIWLYDGTNFQSIADERVKDYFFDNVSRTNKELTFAVYYERTGEVWLCFPSTEDLAAGGTPITSCNKALVWDSRGNAWSRRDLPGVTAGTFGLVDRSSGWTYGDADQGVGNYTPGTYDYDTLWDAALTTYGAYLDDNPFRESLILGGATDLFEMDRTNTAEGVNIVCYARHTDIDLGDKADWHMVLELYVHAEGDPFNVRIGWQDNLNGSVTWSRRNPSTRTLTTG